MGSNSSHTNFDAKVCLSNGKQFNIHFAALIDHILLLRLVISRPVLTRQGPLLQASIRDYCDRMSTKKMHNRSYQAELPLDIEWIWHVHRLHPLNYYKDCINGSYDGRVVDKEVNRTSLDKYPYYPTDPIVRSSYCYYDPSFKTSIDLVDAVLRQCDFLEKFKNHPFFSIDLRTLEKYFFRNMVQNYVSFIRLATGDDGLVVPTFDIDIIWHTHMRYPTKYRNDTKIMLGYVLNHNDNIEQQVLEEHFVKTAERWEATYKSKYGENIDRVPLRIQSRSSCVIVSRSTAEKRLVRESSGYHSGGGGCAGGCAGGYGGGCGGGCVGGCAGGCGGGCGGG